MIFWSQTVSFIHDFYPSENIFWLAQQSIDLLARPSDFRLKTLIAKGFLLTCITTKWVLALNALKVENIGEPK